MSTEAPTQIGDEALALLASVKDLLRVLDHLARTKRGLVADVARRDPAVKAARALVERLDIAR